MRLNLNCVRSVLLAVEENTGLHKPCYFVDFELNEELFSIGGQIEPQAFQDELHELYENEELMYHVHYCVSAGLLVRMKGSPDYQVFISNLTPKGHSFIENTRDDKIWKGIMEITAKLGIKSLEGAFQIISGVVTQLINAHFMIGGM